MFYPPRKTFIAAAMVSLMAFLMLLSSFAPAENNFPTPYVLKLPKDIPAPYIPSDNPLTVEGVELGKKLFQDPLLSDDRKVSCATCHDYRHALTDNKPLSTGIHGRQAARNSMPLFNMAWVTPYFWDGRAKTLEEVIPFPLTNANEMGRNIPELIDELNASAEYRSLFSKAFGVGDINEQRLYKAIAQYVRTLTSFSSPADTIYPTAAKLMYDKSIRQPEAMKILFGFSEKTIETLELCEKCHSTITYGNIEMRNNGLDADNTHDKGLGAITGKPEDIGKFKAPSFRNLLSTAPYMHDGRSATLEDVIEHYNTGIQPNPNLDPLLKDENGNPLRLNLSQREKEQIMYFLVTLMTDSAFINDLTLNY